MAIGIGFANDEYHEETLDDYYREELYDAPMGVGGFVRDVCYERAMKRYEDDHQPEERQQGFI